MSRHNLVSALIMWRPRLGISLVFTILVSRFICIYPKPIIISEQAPLQHITSEINGSTTHKFSLAPVQSTC